MMDGRVGLAMVQRLPVYELTTSGTWNRLPI